MTLLWLALVKNWQQMLYSCNHVIVQAILSQIHKPLPAEYNRERSNMYLYRDLTHTLRATHVHELFQAVRTQGWKLLLHSTPLSARSIYPSIQDCFVSQAAQDWYRTFSPLSNTHTFVSLSLQRLCWTYFSISIMTFVNLCILNFH